MEVRGQIHALAALPPGKGAPRYPLDRLAGPQSCSGQCGVKKNVLPLLGIEPRQSNPWPIASTNAEGVLLSGI
jgi:hypothetical protein